MNRYSLLFFHSVSEFKLRMFIDVEKTDFRIRALQRPFFHFRLYFVCVNDLLRILWLHFTSFAYKSMLWRWQTKWMDIFKSDCRTHTNRMHIHWLTRTRLSISLLTPHFWFLDFAIAKTKYKFLFSFFFLLKKTCFYF